MIGPTFICQSVSLSVNLSYYVTMFLDYIYVARLQVVTLVINLVKQSYWSEPECFL